MPVLVVRLTVLFALMLMPIGTMTMALRRTGHLLRRMLCLFSTTL